MDVRSKEEINQESCNKLQFCMTDTNIPNYMKSRRNAAHPTSPVLINRMRKKPHRDKQCKDSYGLHTNMVLNLSLKSAEVPRYFQVQLHSSSQGHRRWV